MAARLELEVFVLGEVLHHVLVDRLGEVHNLEAAGGSRGDVVLCSAGRDGCAEKMVVSLCEGRLAPLGQKLLDEGRLLKRLLGLALRLTRGDTVRAWYAERATDGCGAGWMTPS